MAQNKTQRMIEHIAKHGAARTDEIAEALKLSTGTVSASLIGKVRDGTLVSCKAARPGKPPQNEYRIGSGIQIHDKPYTPPRVPPISRPAAAREPQPEVGSNTGSTALIPPGRNPEPAPDQGPRRSPETPVAPPASAADGAERRTDAAALCALNSAGCLTLILRGQAFELSNAETRELGEFLSATEPAWN